MSDEIIKQTDAILHQWGNGIRSGSRINLKAKISAVYGSNVVGIELEDNIVEDVDHVVNRLADPMRRVLKRHYVDEHPFKKGTFYNDRTHEQKAKTERLDVRNFYTYLSLGRHMAYTAFQYKGLIA